MEILDIVMISMTIFTIWFWSYHWNKPVESSLELFWCVAIATLVPFVLIYYLVMVLRVIQLFILGIAS